MNDRLSFPAAILTGPTATGKSSLAIEFALEHGEIELINADSLLIYRYANIGTAKPTTHELSQAPHHLINVRDPGEAFTAGDFVRETERILNDLHARGKRALIVGGSGFYLKALRQGLWEQAPASDPLIRAELETRSTPELAQELRTHDAESASRIGPNDRYRIIRALEIFRQTGSKPSTLTECERPPSPHFPLLILDRPSTELERRIQKRAQLMLEQGLLTEYQELEKRFPLSRELQSVGYLQVGRYLREELPPGRKTPLTPSGLIDEIVLGTRQLMKKQRTWFRGQKDAEWFILDADRSKLWNRLKTIYS